MNYCEYNNEQIDVFDNVMSLIGTRQYDNALEYINNLDLIDLLVIFAPIKSIIN